MAMSPILRVYETLYLVYGPQGWWPLSSFIKKNLRNSPYHPDDYSLPRKEADRFEVGLGAILTQNTSWLQVEKTIQNLKDQNLLYPEKLIEIPVEDLAPIIKPAGYFNQKAKKLKYWASFFLDQEGGIPSREKLLKLWGVGPETADSILLYAYHEPYFVIDAYTRRIFSRLGLISGKEAYEELRSLFEVNLPPKSSIYNEYHALIVCLAKEHCRKKADCDHCSLSQICQQKGLE